MEKNEKIGLQKMSKRYYNTCKRLHKVARNCAKEKGGEGMNERAITIVSPVNGTAVLLEQVPDAVFADKIFEL